MFFVVIKSIIVDRKEDVARSACPYSCIVGKKFGIPPSLVILRGRNLPIWNTAISLGRHGSLMMQ
jgi:hypothetical protein